MFLAVLQDLRKGDLSKGRSGAKLDQHQMKCTTPQDQLTLGKGREYTYLPPKHHHLRFRKQALGKYVNVHTHVYTHHTPT